MEMEKEVALKKNEAEVELKKIEAETTSHPWGPKEKSSNPRSPKLPYFDEHTDKMDSYLTRFESYVMSNKWDPSMWASYLSALLKGRAYHANILRLCVEQKTEASHCLLSAEASMPLSEDDDDESDEYSLEDCTFPSYKEIEKYRDVSISDELTDEQKKEVKELLAKYPDVLTSIPGKTELLEHDIKLSTAEPVRSMGYPLPYKTREIMESEIDEMIELGVIEPSISPYSSPIVLVPKKYGSVRFCIDFHKLNKVTEFDAEPMPNMEEVINRMSGQRFYSQMDLCKGYWQLGLSKRSRLYTAFETPKGLIQFKTMPFSLVNVGASFCRLIRIVLQGLRNVDSFVDDMWIFTETWEKHLKSIKATLDRLRAAKLTAKPSKCKIG